MKTICLVKVMICLFLVGCNGLFKSDDVKNFIPGTYSAAWSTEFSESRDTLLIAPMMKQGSETYTITRRTHVTYTPARKRDPEYKIARWTGSYDEGAKIVVVMNNGRVLSFDPVAGEMKMGITTYKKL